MSGDVLELYFNKGTSSQGILAKSFHVEDGKEYLVKTGEYKAPRFDTISVVVEVIVCEIGKLLGVNVANYTMDNCIVKSVDNLFREQQTLVCFSELFTTDNKSLIHCDKFLKSKNSRTNYNTLCGIFSGTMRQFLDDMIVFDYLILNTDRHTKNFGVLYDVENDCSEFAPLYDHGYSLGSSADLDYLECDDCDFDYLYDDVDYSKCFELSNSSQLKYVKRTTLNLDIDISLLFAVIDKYSNYIKSKELVNFMKYILERGLRNVRRIFTKEQGYYIRIVE